MIEDYSQVTKNIREELKEYIVENNIKSLVIGISGGIDSTVCCALAKPVCDLLTIPLIGVSMPIITNKNDEIMRAGITGEVFCTERIYQDNLYKPLNEIVPLLSDDISTDKKSKIRIGNIKARLRMIYLYDIAQANNGIVLSTDNYTELLLGFWTLHGDVGDYGMIQNLWKTEVYALAEYLSSVSTDEEKRIINDCIAAVPTDGFGITNSDLEQFGAKSYHEVDSLLKRYILNERTEELETNSVIQRHIATRFKRDNPYNISRVRLLRKS